MVLVWLGGALAVGVSAVDGAAGSGPSMTPVPEPATTTAASPPDATPGSGSSPGWGLERQSVSLRVRVSGEGVLGVEQPEPFNEVDLAITYRLPWASYQPSGWGVGSRLLVSLGWMTGESHAAVVLSALPLLAVGSRDGRFAVDLGAGAAALSRHRFEDQDFGGYVQFALTAGVTVPVYRRLGLGYRFMHYSDAAMYGPHTVGADFHMLEVSYRF